MLSSEHFSNSTLSELVATQVTVQIKRVSLAHEMKFSIGVL